MWVHTNNGMHFINHALQNVHHFIHVCHALAPLPAMAVNEMQWVIISSSSLLHTTAAGSAIAGIEHNCYTNLKHASCYATFLTREQISSDWISIDYSHRQWYNQLHVHVAFQTFLISLYSETQYMWFLWTHILFSLHE